MYKHHVIQLLLLYIEQAFTRQDSFLLKSKVRTMIYTCYHWWAYIYIFETMDNITKHAFNLFVDQHVIQDSLISD